MSILFYSILLVYTYTRFLNLRFSYATSSCSIKIKKRAKQSPGKTSVTIGVKIGGKNAAVIKYCCLY